MTPGWRGTSPEYLSEKCASRVRQSVALTRTLGQFLSQMGESDVFNYETNDKTQGECLLNAKVFAPGQVHAEKFDPCEGY